MSTPSPGFVPNPSTHLLAAVQQGSEGWRRLEKLVKPACYNWLRRKGLQAADAEDIIQDAFSSIAKNIHRFDGAKKFGPWVFTILQRARIDHWRRRANKPLAQGGSDFLDAVKAVPDPSGEESGFDKELLKQALETVQQEVPASRWESFRRVKLEGEAPDSVAKTCGKSVQAIYMDVFRVIQRLKDLLCVEAVA